MLFHINSISKRFIFPKRKENLQGNYWFGKSKAIQCLFDYGVPLKQGSCTLRGFCFFFHQTLTLICCLGCLKGYRSLESMRSFLPGIFLSLFRCIWLLSAGSRQRSPVRTDVDASMLAPRRPFLITVAVKRCLWRLVPKGSVEFRAALVHCARLPGMISRSILDFQ